MDKLYVASSWSNTKQPRIVELLRCSGYVVYDFRNPSVGNKGFHWEEIDLAWESWTPEKYIEKVTNHPKADEGFNLDKDALDWCDTCVVVLPCGRSAHLEAGYAIGKGKKVIFYLVQEGFKPELMYLLGSGIVCNDEDLLTALRTRPGVEQAVGEGNTNQGRKT